MRYTVTEIVAILQVDAVVINDHVVEHLLLDSRKAFLPGTSLFFALSSPRRDGHDFIGELYQKGVRSFVVDHLRETPPFEEANFIRVRHVLSAMQQLAAFHRSRFSIPVIGITGSNGKTIVKEWLFQLLQPDYNIVRSPKSYNSQIGVPLSIWLLRPHHTLAIFEAGISTKGEMEKLASLIQPTIGILTNIGDAHSEGFLSRAETESEKRKLFSQAVLPQKIAILQAKKTDRGTILTGETETDGVKTVEEIEIPFTDQASIQNALTCWELMRHLHYDASTIRARMRQLVPIDMRLSLKRGVRQCLLINDSYSADIGSLFIALDFLVQQAGSLRKTVILSDFLQQSQEDISLYRSIMDGLQQKGVDRVIAIGSRLPQALVHFKNTLPGLLECYPSTDAFLSTQPQHRFYQEAILVKGARIFGFERIVQVLEQQLHETRLEIDLAALLHNLHQYQQHLQPSTRIMAMVKAFAYGSGAAQVASLLQFHKVDYLGVAYADEGIALRQVGITLPIMVMNPAETTFEALVAHQLEPVIYSSDMLRTFDIWLQKEAVSGYPIHLEIDTGLHRLGIDIDQIESVTFQLLQTGSFNIKSVFSHLAASEDPREDAFTIGQLEKFRAAASWIEKKLGYTVIKHIANSAAAIRYRDCQLDMVRIGIGLYGVEMAKGLSLMPVATLRATIAQVRSVDAGEAVSYNRLTVLNRPSKIATVRLGYADGYPRNLGDRRGQVLIKGQRVPIVGAICMDMMMIDVTDVANVTVGEEVILFGPLLQVQEVAAWAGTIPYEILTGIADRVKRIYYEQ